MYLTRLTLTNIRCFEELTIEFDRPGSFVLILGDNGDGKSTLLRCLAMGLCDESSASALFRELSGEFVRRDPVTGKRAEAGYGTIKAELADTDGTRYEMVTKIRALEAFERVTQELWQVKDGSRRKLNQDTFPWKKIFVTGYGPGMRTHGTADYQEYLAVDAVYPLFRYDVPLQNPELGVRRLVDAAEASAMDAHDQQERPNKVLDTVKKLLAKVLNLETTEAVELTATGLVVSGHWGRAQLGGLGDGYRATTTWILDVIAWWFLHHRLPGDKSERGSWRDLDTCDLRGIVIIDELEQHLHPSWQRVILRLLRESFPKLQLVATTHSPMCVVGTTELRDEDLNIFVLRPVGGKVERLKAEPPRGRRADQVLTSFLFGLETASDSDIKQQIARYTHLARKPRTESEEAEFVKLRQDLDTILGSGETELERHVATAVRRVLESQPEPRFPRESVDYELRRQLRELLGRLGE